MDSAFVLASPMTWWLTGLPAAGKTTLAQALAVQLRQLRQAVCVLDGDDLRSGLCSDLDFSSAGRDENVRRTAEIAALLNRQGIHAIVALVSPTQAGRSLARQKIGQTRFVEVHLSTPLAVCEKRDFKKLYEKARLDPEFALTGLNAPYEVPYFPEVAVDSSSISTDCAVEALLVAALKKMDESNG